jgi:hypothetical protein
LALAEPSASISCRFLQILLVHALVDYSIDLRTFQFARKTLFVIVSRLCTRPSSKPQYA